MVNKLTADELKQVRANAKPTVTIHIGNLREILADDNPDDYDHIIESRDRLRSCSKEFRTAQSMYVACISENPEMDPLDHEMCRLFHGRAKCVLYHY